ncbi:response regulator transcription factor [Pseudoprimorskyibacter insulae]|uniref:Transcriptional regulatory protein DegU n=1 Tax=Pseudoprimorskyibacter insulae TaxID=1695997 RepID=A0A2R8AUH9_9RHOB|nr:response regulator transcription factor [Pseudoprimorskyibacter insulae]SPF79557.1 Transcriptional regulatory protein DegU [Pseudoprimorskyibacter insulae]
MRLLIADDHDLVRDTVAAYLSSGGFESVSTVPNLDEAIARTVSEGAFDLVFLDYNMPGMNGLSGLDRMIKANQGKPVAILSGSASRDVAQAALAAGASGFIPKTLSAKALISAARFMLSGEVYAPFEFMRGTDQNGDHPQLTRRELDVLRGICAGKSNKEIAQDYGLQEVTVKLHAKTLSRKLGARNRTHAAMIARDRCLV